MNVGLALPLEMLISSDNTTLRQKPEYRWAEYNTGTIGRT